MEIDCGYQYDRNVLEIVKNQNIDTTSQAQYQAQAKAGYSSDNKQLNGVNEGFSVAFDPLDGSSIVDANFAVGTIAGIWPGKGLLNRRGKEQVRIMELR